MSSAGYILIADDSEDSRRLLSGILVAEGYNVRTADSGMLALDAAYVNPPELVLLDMRMPGMNGIEVCRELKARPECCDVPVIFLSASVDFEDRMGGLEAGAVDFLNKPFYREELLARLKTHLDLARLRKDLEQRVAQRTADLQVAYNGLRESEHRFRSIADTVPVGIWMSEPAGPVTYASQWILTFSGWTMEQIAGDGWRLLVHPEDLQRLVAEGIALLPPRKLFQVECRFRRADGEYRSVVILGIPRFVQQDFAGFIGSMVDFTELKRSQEYALANQKMESLGVLAAGIAHDFGNLLSTVLAHSDVALSEVAPESPVSKHLSSIATVAVRASEIVQLLMAYAGHSDADASAPVEPRLVIEEMVHLLKVTFPRSTTIEIRLPEELPPIWGNAPQFRQVVLNLIVNGSEALQGRPGTVVVSASRVRVSRESKSRPVVLAEGDYVRLEVSDTGSGMTAETQAKVFDPFFSTKSLGRGMGLASVQGIVNNAGGAVSVVSAVGQGSTFSVWLPCSDVQYLLHNKKIPGVVSNLAGTVLLVDDDDALRISVSAALRKDGFSVLEARDGLGAIPLFAKYCTGIDIAVLETTLPGLSGYDVYEEILRLRANLPVIFTRAGDQEAVDQSAWQTSYHHIQKPYRRRELIQAIREILAPAIRPAETA